jgi:hypothetical protein
MLPFFGSCIIHILHTGVLKKLKNSGAKRLNIVGSQNEVTIKHTFLLY